jgi:hypothetical protein
MKFNNEQFEPVPDQNAVALPILTSAAELAEEVGLKLIRKDSFDFGDIRHFEGARHRAAAERLIAWRLEMKNSSQWTTANEDHFQEMILREKAFWSEFRKNSENDFQSIWRTRVNCGLNEDVIRLALQELELVVEPLPVVEKKA